MKNATLVFLLLTFSINSTLGQVKDSKLLFKEAFNEQLKMLEGSNPIDFKRAVFITENAFSDGQLSYKDFCRQIADIGNLLKSFIKQKELGKYKTAGNYAVFTYMMDSSAINNFKPLAYDFDDFMGDKDWKSMFVTKLMKTHQGNCHSLPYYYKILCEEIGVSASLSLAPNHVYIKHIDERGDWVNVELTSGGFPRDQWIIQQMNISIDAIKCGSYMTPLSAKESIAMTMFDLASAYNNKYGYDSFVLEIANTALLYFPKCIPLLQTKANFYKNSIQAERKRVDPDTTLIEENVMAYKQINSQIDSLGYKEESKEMYDGWVKSVENEKAKRNSSGSK